MGRFLEITTDQLTVTGNASFVNATAHHVWSAIVTAEQGEFEQIKAGMLAANAVSADNIQVGALDGKVITGATLQSDRTPGRGVKIDSAGIRAYTGLANNTAFEVDASTGKVKVLGEVGIQDSWSIAKFIDIVEDVTGNDIGERGDRWGVGLYMNKLSSPYKFPALVTFKEDPSVKGGILYFQAPSNANGNSPNMRLSSNNYQVYSGKTTAWSLQVGSTGFGAGAPGKGNINVYDYAATITVGSYHTSFEMQGNSFRLESPTNRWRAVWGYDGASVLGWDQNHQVVVDSHGFRAVGGKTFIMRVPGEWQKRHMMLQHACTESPYDGIEYWENVELDSTGRAIWVLPDYVPKIASPTAPWIALTSSSATATLVRTGYGSDAAPWSVEVTGTPGETVAVLVKGARQIDVWDPETDDVTFRDRSRDSVWVLPPASSPGDAEAGDAVVYDTHGGYGPVPKPSTESPAKKSQEES